MRKSANKIISVFIFVLCLILSVCLTDFKEVVTTNSKNIDLRKTVIIDAGHGGFDGGAVASDGTSEKDVNLSIAKKLKQMFSIYGINVIMTRDDDTALDDSGEKLRTKKISDMKNRLAFMKQNPDGIFVSIHLNKFTTSAARGAQIFYSPNNEQSKILAKSIKDSIVSLLQNDNKREIKKGTDNIYLLKNAEIPAVIVECGFLSNHQELELLKTESYQKKMAFSIFCGIINYM